MGKPNIALLVAHFDPGCSYWEPAVIPALTEHFNVHVVTSTTRSFDMVKDTGVESTRAYDAGTSTFGGYTVHRVRPILELRSRVLARGISDILGQIKPTRVIVSGSSQVLPLAGVRWAHKHGVPLTYVSGEHRGQRPHGGVARTASDLYWNTAGRGLFRLAAGNASQVVVYTPDTRDMVIRATGRSDVVLTSLPVDTRIFNYSGDVRRRVRVERGWTGKRIVAYAGKFEPRKRLPEFARLFTAVEHSSDIRLVFIGAANSPESLAIAAELKRAGGASRVDVLPFLSAQQLAETYQGADLAYFPCVSIGIQQALATGIQVLVPDVREVAHLSDFGLSNSLSSYGDGNLLEAAQLARSLPLDALEPGSDQVRERRARQAESFSTGHFLQQLVPEYAWDG